MSRSTPFVALVVALVGNTPDLAAQMPQSQTPLRIAASSFVTTEVHINARKIGKKWYDEDASLTGPSRIAITWSQPHARGRKVEGGLIPVDTVWRFGANAATALHTDVDLTLGDLKLQAGDYSLFVLYSGTAWQLIVNRGTGIWGTDRDPAKDAGRVSLRSRALSEPEESLSIYLVPESGKPSDGYAELRGTLRIKWGKTELSADWRVEQ